MFRYIAFSLFIFSASLQAQVLDAFEAKNSPISDFVHWVSMQTSENIILGRGVDGVISVNVSSINSSDIMSLFTHVMSANGYSVVKVDDFYKVMIDQQQLIDIEPQITKIYKLNNISSINAKLVFDSLLVAATLSPGTDETGEGEQLELSNVNISNHIVTVLPANNSLLVSATSDKIKALDKRLVQIDSPMKQVLIEAVIVESDVTGADELGVNLSTALVDTGFSFVSNQLGTIKNLTGITKGGHLSYSKGGDVRALVTALNKDGNTDILSTPTIFVMDREQGRISVGQNVPFLVGTRTTENGDTIQDIERQDVGVTLTVTPVVLGNGKVILSILQESSSVTASTIATDIITNNRSITTVAQVSDGESILLGGLISEQTRDSKSGIPLLMDIPWLGWLFSYKSHEVVNRELTVMIKTTLI
jgi:general secretion pathway protein D